MAYTYDELVKMGAKPVQQPQQKKKAYTYEELTKMGAKPVSEPTQATQTKPYPEQDFVTGVGVGLLKGAGSTLESGVRSVGQIGGGLTGAVSVPIQERKQADLTNQYEQALRDKNPELARQIQQQIQGAGKVSSVASQAFDNPLLARIRENLKPKTTGEKIGYGAEKIGEFFIPAGLQKQLTQGAGMLGRAGTQGLASAGIKLAQTGVRPEKGQAYEDMREALKTGAIAGAVTAGAEMITKGIANVLQKAGQKIQTVTIKPLGKGMKEGFKAENIKKYGVGGNLNQSLVKTNDKLNQYRQQLQGLIKGSDSKVNLNEVIKEVDDYISLGQTKRLGSNKQVIQAFDDLYDDLVSITKGKSKVDMLTAQDLKIAAGTQGSWQYGKFDPDARAKEEVYNVFYNAIKKQIEKATPAGDIKNINKAMSELIPIKNALIRRIPIAARQSPIGLLDGIALVHTLSSANPLTLSFLAARGISGSAKAGTALVDIGSALSKAPEQAGGLLSRFISGMR